MARIATGPTKVILQWRYLAGSVRKSIIKDLRRYMYYNAYSDPRSKPPALAQAGIGPCFRALRQLRTGSQLGDTHLAGSWDSPPGRQGLAHLGSRETNQFSERLPRG